MNIQNKPTNRSNCWNNSILKFRISSRISFLLLNGWYGSYKLDLSSSDTYDLFTQNPTSNDRARLLCVEFVSRIKWYLIILICWSCPPAPRLEFSGEICVLLTRRNWLDVNCVIIDFSCLWRRGKDRTNMHYFKQKHHSI